MSEIKVNSIKGVGASAAAITVNNTDGTCTANITNNLSNRRLTINGAMTISQRGTSKTNVQDGYNTVDRFNVNGVTGTFTMSQESDAPAGFAKSLKMLATADISAAAGNIKEVFYSFEGQDLQLLEKGTSTAKKVTLSFYVKSNVTGLKTVYLLDKDNTRLISKDYTINVSATWERKTITFDGDTTGALDNDNARSLDIHFPIVAGSNYTGGTQSTAWGADTVNERVNSSITQIDTTNEYWQITGVQLEVGSVATDFEHRSFGQELALCQRYCELIRYEGYAFTGIQPNASSIEHFIHWNVEKRTNPTVTLPTLGTGSGQINPTNYAGSNLTGGNIGVFTIRQTCARVTGGSWSNGTAAAPCSLYTGGSTGIIKIESEL